MKANTKKLHFKCNQVKSNASKFIDILKYVLSTKFNDIFFKKFLIQPHQGVIYHNEQFNCIKF